MSDHYYFLDAPTTLIVHRIVIPRISFGSVARSEDMLREWSTLLNVVFIKPYAVVAKIPVSISETMGDSHFHAVIGDVVDARAKFEIEIKGISHRIFIMIKYMKLGQTNSGLEVLQAQGWLVVGEIISESDVYVKLVKVDQEHVDRLLQSNPNMIPA